MKGKIFFIFFILFSSIALAQPESEKDGGILPNSRLWALDLRMERVVLFLTPGTEGKIMKELEYVEERNKELNDLGLDADEESVNKAELQLEKGLSNADRLGAKISDLAQKKKMEDLVSAARQHHLDVLEEVKLKVPDKAKMKIQMVIDRQIDVPEIKVGY